MNRHAFLPLLALMGCGMVSSCFDKDFDLKDVDTTVGTTGDLWLPNSSTDSIRLKNILDLKEEDIVKNIDGTYYLVEKGTVNGDSFKVSRIHLDSPEIQDFKNTLDVTTRRSESESSQKTRVYYPLENMAHYEILPTSDEVDDDIVDVTSVTCQPVKVIFHIQPPTFPSFVSNYHIDDLTFSVPKGVHVSSCVMDGKEILTSEALREKARTEGIIEVIDGEDRARQVGGEIVVTLTLTGSNVGEGMFAHFSNHKVELQGTVSADGWFRVTRDEIDESKLTDNQRNLLNSEGLSAIMPGQVDVRGTGEFENDVEVYQADCTLRHKAGENGTIELDNLPDFMNDDEVVFDLDNPVIFLEVTNPLPAEVSTGLTLTSLYETQEDVTKSTGEITVPAQSTRVLYLADRDEDIVVPEEYKGMTLQYVHVAGLNELFRKIPKRIHIDVWDIVASCKGLELGNEYQVDVRYNLYTPITFGPDFTLVYQGTEDGWADDISANVGRLDGKEIGAKGRVYSDLPEAIEVTITPLDQDGNRIEDLLVTQNWPVETDENGADFAFSIKPAEGHSLREFLSGSGGHKLDGVHYHVKLVTTKGGTLREDAHLKLTNVRIGIIGGVTYNEEEE